MVNNAKTIFRVANEFNKVNNKNINNNYQNNTSSENSYYSDNDGPNFFI